MECRWTFFDKEVEEGVTMARTSFLAFFLSRLVRLTTSRYSFSARLSSLGVLQGRPVRPVHQRQHLLPLLVLVPQRRGDGGGRKAAGEGHQKIVRYLGASRALA
jgi:hypothetical protein